jgi:hypothetical protein
MWGEVLGNSSRRSKRSRIDSVPSLSEAFTGSGRHHPIIQMVNRNGPFAVALSDREIEASSVLPPDQRKQLFLCTLSGVLNA